MKYIHKAQVLLSEEEFLALKKSSRETGKKISALIREAVDKVYVQGRKNRQIRQAVDSFLTLAPVDIPKKETHQEDSAEE